MSAFIVSDKVINQILSGLQAANSDYERIKPPISFDFDKVLGAAMRGLNARAIQARYPDTVEHPENMPGPIDLQPYRFQPEPCSLIQAYKSFRCWLYQCNEGDCDQDMLYQWGEEASARLAMDIVNNMPEYETAKWD